MPTDFDNPANQNEYFQVLATQTTAMLAYNCRRQVHEPTTVESRGVFGRWRDWPSFEGGGLLYHHSKPDVSAAKKKCSWMI